MCFFLGDEPTFPEPDSVTSDPVLRLDLDCEVALGVVEDNKNGIRKYMKALTFPALGVKRDKEETKKLSEGASPPCLGIEEVKERIKKRTKVHSP